jgi:UDP-N-acetylmuramate--alanine ligase
VIKPDLTVVLPPELRRVHFVGIGGSGMSGIARMFAGRGISVTGSDRSESATTRALRDAGIVVHIGHDAANLGDAEAVVVTGALWEDNPEYQRALASGIPVAHRSVALNWLLTGHHVFAVAGAHGKTTTTAMVVTALRESGADPSFVNGGVVSGYGVSAAAGSTSEFVIEADESDGSFLLYDTAFGIITNIDTDHLDHYGSQSAVDDAFVLFANSVSHTIAVSSDDAGVAAILPRITSRVVTFGESASADFRITDIVSSGQGVTAQIIYAGESHRLELAVAGRHNAINACGAVAVLVASGVSCAAAVVGLSAFRGTGRRFELHATIDGVRVFDDYAHHPTEVRAALATARSVVGEGRVIAIHQPHLYSRTQAMASDFATEYEAGADFTVVLDVYGAREDPIEGVTGALVSSAFRDSGKVAYCPDWDDAARVAANHARPGDIIMTLSCGDVYRIIPQVCAALESR